MHSRLAQTYEVFAILMDKHSFPRKKSEIWGRQMKSAEWKDMLNRRIFASALFLLMFWVSPDEGPLAESHVWQELAPGLYLGTFDPRMRSKICNHKIVIFKIDPRFHSLKLLSASEMDRKPRTAKEWCKEFGLHAAINASMYQNMEPLKSTGYMRNEKHLNNSYVNPAFGAFLCFNPVEASVPEVQIVDRRLQKDWKRVIKKYRTVVQNYRMISEGRKTGWPQREEIYGSAAIGMDRDNHVLFILSRSPFSTHDLIHILLSLPIHIVSAMYVEGGPEATLYLKVRDKEMTVVGTCEADTLESGTLKSIQRIPNVIGVVERKGAANVGRD
jgi:hypothetical protein